MGAAWFVAIADLRRNRLRLVILAVLVALVGGVSVASILGADRSRTSLDRFIEETNAADAAVFTEDPSAYDEVADLPEVEAVSPFSLLAVVPEAVDGSDDGYVPMLHSLDGRVPYDLNAVRVVEGELPSPDDSDRIALHEPTADLLGVGVGDRVPMVGYSPTDVEQLFATDGEGGEPTGPRFELEVAGLIRDPLDVVARPSDMVLNPLTRGVAERYRKDVGSFGGGAFVELRSGESVESLTAAVRERGLEVGIERWVGSEPVRDTGFGPTLDLIGDGLLVFGTVVAIAGLLVIGQAFVRSAVTARSRGDALDAIGLDRRGRRFVAAAPGTVVALAGGLLVVPIATALSALFPIGIARRAEPDPGVDFEPAIIVGALVTAVVLLGVAWLAAHVVALRQIAAPRAARPTSLGLRAPGPVGRTVSAGAASSVRSTSGAVLLGAAGVVAAVVFASSLEHLLDTPAHYGWSFDTTVEGQGFDATELVDGVDLEADPAVAEVAETVFQISLEVEGSPMFGHAIGDGSGQIVPVVAHGQTPRGADEVAVGREALRRIGASVGDLVDVSAGGRTAQFRIVGQAVVPVSGDGGRLGDGVTMTLPAAERLGVDGASSCGGDQTCFAQTALRWREGVDVGAARDRLLLEGSEFERATPPPEVERLQEVEAIPWILAGLLGALATVATLHAIIVTVARRRHDLAVLRALGATPGDARRGVTAHAAMMVVVAALAGAVAGVAFGRLLWGSVAGSVGVVAAPSVPVLGVVLLPVAIVLFAVVASLLPARRAGQLRPSAILRAE